MYFINIELSCLHIFSFPNTCIFVDKLKEIEHKMLPFINVKNIFYNTAYDQLIASEYDIH